MPTVTQPASVSFEPLLSTATMSLVSASANRSPARTAWARRTCMSPALVTDSSVGGGESDDHRGGDQACGQC